MAIAHPWYWQIQALGQGPDYYFWATFLPHEADPLAAFVARHHPPNFCHHRTARAPHRMTCYAQYVDRHTYEKLQAQARGEDIPVWVAATIEVCDHTLSITNLLGGDDDGETALLIEIAQAANLTMQQWRVSYGGDGYAGGDVAQGNESHSLLAYLNRADSGPD
jgi:hypothetical protein